MPAAPRGGDRRVLHLPAGSRGRRLDLAIAALLPEESRASVQRLIRQGRVRVAGEPARAASRVRGGERVVLEMPEPVRSDVLPEAIPLSILYEDEDVVVIDKPAGLTVHPGAGRHGGTLVNALLHRGRGLSGVGGLDRPGIVHRLDRDTSGVLAVAKNDLAHRRLAAQFKDRTVRKVYEALVWGTPDRPAGTLDSPIGRHPVMRTRMTARSDGRPSRTDWRIAERLGPVCLLEVRPHTGRTHQIRVHLSHAGHPVVGDPLYGRRRSGSGGSETLSDALLAEAGLLLHARALEFEHPRDGRRITVEAPRPERFERVLAVLRSPGKGRRGGGGA